MSFPTGWTKQCSLTIDNTKVSGTANLTNFPVLLTEANFPSTIFDNTQSAGQDLRFSSDSAGTTELAFEIVNWDTTNDKAEIWVKVTTVYCDDDTVFYAWYGNATATAYGATDTYGTHAVWDDYEGVWHLTNATDSSPNGYDLTPSASAPTQSAGKIGTATTGSYTFDRTNHQQLSIADASCPNLEISGSQTWSCWAKVTISNDDGVGVPVGKAGSGDPPHKQIWYLTSSNSSHGIILFWIAGLSTNNVQTTTQTYLYNNWHYTTGVYDSDNSKLRIIVNGDTYETSSSGTATDTNGTFAIGNRGDMDAWNAHMTGPVDEVRIRDSAVTDGWAITEYNNQSAPSTFVTEGTETDVGSTGISASKRIINC